MLLPVIKVAAMCSIPSKLQAYMFSQKPIIASLDLQSDTARAILESDCGLGVEAENEQALICALQETIQWQNSGILMRKGYNGFNYAMERFSKKHNLSLITNLIEAYVC